ncbi:MAG: hypothetical protein IJW28_03325, partial [Clostridia bacterium]|nr:hypothetical protein [Clostridia bacterium]
MKKKHLLLSIFMICFTIFSGMLVGCGNPDPMIVYINSEEDFIRYYNDNFPSKYLVFENWMGKQYADVISYELTTNITITTPLKNKVTKFYESRINDEDYTEEEARGFVGSNRTYVIDGKGYTVSGLSFTGYMAGFIGSNYGSVTIKNITFDNMTINSFGLTGGILGKAEGTVELDNVHITNSTISNSENQATGGFIGYTNANITIKDCSIRNTTINGNLETKMGGMIGYAYRP